MARSIQSDTLYTTDHFYIVKSNGEKIFLNSAEFEITPSFIVLTLTKGATSNSTELYEYFKEIQKPGANINLVLFKSKLAIAEPVNGVKQEFLDGNFTNLKMYSMTAPYANQIVFFPFLKLNMTRDVVREAVVVTWKNDQSNFTVDISTL